MNRLGLLILGIAGTGRVVACLGCMFKGSEWAPMLMKYLSGGRLVFVAGQVPDQFPLEPRPNFYNSKDQDSNQGNLPLYVLYINELLDLLKNHKRKYLPSKGESRRCQYNMCSVRYAEVTILERSVRQ